MLVVKTKESVLVDGVVVNGYRKIVVVKGTEKLWLLSRVGEDRG